jgi:hypothetical protein
MQFIPINADGIPSSYSAQGPILPIYNATQATNPSTAGLPFDLGDKWFFMGNQYQCVYIDAVADTVLSAGVLLTPTLPITGTVTAAGSTVQVINVSLSGLGAANTEVGNLVHFADLATSRYLKGNTTTSVTVSLTTSLIGNNKADADALPSVPANGSAVSLYRPYHVSLSGAVPLVPVGVLLADTDISLGAKVIMQIGGYALVLSNNTGAATVSGSLAIPIANGVASGGSATGPYSMIALEAYNSASNALVPFMVNFTGV